MKRVPLIQDPDMRDTSVVPSYEGLALRESGQQQVDELLVIPVEDMTDVEEDAYRALLDLLLVNRGMKPTADKDEMWWAPVCAVFACPEGEEPASAPEAGPTPPLPPVDPEADRWHLAPDASPGDAEAWVEQAVRLLGAGYHADTPAEDYEDLMDAGECAAYNRSLIRACSILGEKIHEIGLREFRRRGWAPPEPATALVPGKAYLKLFHGRDRVDQEMKDWGFDGPTFGPVQFVHTTYGCELKVALEDSDEADFTLDIADQNSLVACGGKFYGDWSVFVATPEMARQQP